MCAFTSSGVSHGQSATVVLWRICSSSPCRGWPSTASYWLGYSRTVLTPWWKAALSKSWVTSVIPVALEYLLLFWVWFSTFLLYLNVAVSLCLTCMYWYFTTYQISSTDPQRMAHTHMHTRMHMHIHTHMHACAHAHTHTHTSGWILATSSSQWTLCWRPRKKLRG